MGEIWGEQLMAVNFTIAIKIGYLFAIFHGTKLIVGVLCFSIKQN